MRQRGLLLCAVLLSVTVLVNPVWADKGDDGPVTAGYAIVTPTGSNATGLVVFETFGEHEGNNTLQAGVLPADMTTDAIVFVSSEGRLSRNAGVAVANPGSKDAKLTLTLKRADGSTAATKIIIVPAGHHLASFITEMFADTPEVEIDFTGTLRITSDQPVAVVGLRFRGDKFSTIPVTSLVAPSPVPQVSTGVGGANAVILPQFVTGGGWATQIVIANTGTSPLTVRVDLFDSNGGPLVATLNEQKASSFVNLTIPAGGVLVLSPRDQEGEDDF